MGAWRVVALIQGALGE